MSDDFYRLIPKEGKHLAESHETQGAYRGVYLDDRTNKPSGAGEFVKVDEEDDNSSNGIGIVIGSIIVFGLGVLATKAFPYVRRWTLEKVVPAAKNTWNKIWKKKEPNSISVVSEENFEESPNSQYALSIDVAYNKYQENMSSEEAQRELIEAFVLYYESMRRIQRVQNANVTDLRGISVNGRELLNHLSNSGILESINELLKNNPALLCKSQNTLLSDLFGQEINLAKEYIPITVESLVESLSVDKPE